MANRSGAASTSTRENVRRYEHFIAGQWAAPSSGQLFETYNPATGEVLAHLARGDKQDVDKAVEAARMAFESNAWQEMVPVQRGRILFRIAELIRQQKEELATLESLDTGKPISQARADVEVAARYFEFYGGVADKIMGSTIPVMPGALDFTVREPYGVSAQIIPWNYPIQIGARGIAPALAAGNTVVVKPAEEASLTCLEMARIAQEGGLPSGALNVITGYGTEAGAPLASHSGINHLTFTGSVEVGISVMKAAAENIVPVTLELGGKSPNLLFADAEMAKALPAIVRSILQNCGQTCSAGSRLLVEESVHDAVVREVKERFQATRLGHPLEDPDMGPLISARQREAVLGYVELAPQEGARVVTGGVPPEDSRLRKGYYLLPTLLDEVAPSARVFSEEIFGPVLTVTAFSGVEEALKLANATPYGLVAAVWTRDLSRAHYLASKIRAGQVFINSYGAGGGVELPFGGMRRSGFGREKSLEALLNYTQVKNIFVKYS
ncbi:MAG: aldehyde dehydrogenase family protein [Chloroflexi bacterium]|nr:aldehyde dehydrogenase family protein [Chloroflexota bacterium]